MQREGPPVVEIVSEFQIHFLNQVVSVLVRGDLNAFFLRFQEGGQSGITKRTKIFRIQRKRLDAFFRFFDDFPAVRHIVSRNISFDIEKHDKQHEHQKRSAVGPDQPGKILVFPDLVQNQAKSTGDQQHPESRRNPEFGQTVHRDVFPQPKQGGCHQKNILHEPYIYENPCLLPDGAGALPSEGNQGQQSGKQSGRDQRVGSAMGVFRIGHSAGEGGSRPEIFYVKHILEQEKQVEQNQSARHDSGKEKAARFLLFHLIIAMDQIVVGSDVNVGDNQILITGINFINTPDDYNFTIDGSKLITGTDGHGYANIGDSQFVANTALGQYLITSTSGGAGAINGTLQSVNPQMYRGQVATVAQYANQLAFNNIMFDHAAIVSGQLGPNSDDEIANRYAATNPLFGPYQYSKKDGGLWFKAYGNIENISMTKGIHVDNQAYGAILGADLPVVKLKDGWKLIPSAYVAYNGGHQNYDFVSMYQNGGQIGAMATAYKGNFFTSLLAYGGGYANEMNVRNMGYGATGLADNTGNWFAGVASKSAYNFHLPKNFIIQPTAMVAYNIFGNQNYGSTFGGNLSMNSGFLNGINVAPGVNVIWNKKTFSIYGTAQMVFNIMGGVDGQAGKVTLDDVRMKHPYFEYGLGVVKSFKERLSGYFQFTIMRCVTPPYAAGLVASYQVEQ